MRQKIIKKYMDCLFFFNNGYAYEFYKSHNKRPSLVYLPPYNDDFRNWYERENKFYMTQEEFDKLWELQKTIKKPYSFGNELELSKLKKEYKEWNYYGFI